MSSRRWATAEPIEEPETLLDNEYKGDKAPKLAESIVTLLLAQVVEVMCHLHGESIVHRDLKPTNSVIAGQGNVQVDDLWLAYHEENGGNGGWTESVYCAPEMQGKRPSTKAIDAFAVGAGVFLIVLQASPLFQDLRLKYSYRRTGDPLAQVLAGMEDIHRQGIGHRDIKSDNILFDAQGIVKRIWDPGYKASEQYTSTLCGQKLDVYGFGALLYRLLEGGAPAYKQTETNSFKRASAAAAEVVRATLRHDPGKCESNSEYGNGTEM
ncbi:Phosphoenolpyruvate carboxylase kinase 1 [Mortierella sp. 14UC]|nr:Phosphoenolpyruvate carboxylase kinase 1 [Mortierella sp. 14UC]